MTKCIGILLFLMMHLNHSHHLSCSVSWWTHSYERVQLKTTYKEVYACINLIQKTLAIIMEAWVYIQIVVTIHSTYNAFGQGLNLFYGNSGTIRNIIRVANLCFCTTHSSYESITFSRKIVKGDLTYSKQVSKKPQNQTTKKTKLKSTSEKDVCIFSNCL